MALRDTWDQYKREPRYVKSPCPFPPRRMSVFEKIDSDIMSLLMIVGIGSWLVVIVISLVT